MIKFFLGSALRVTLVYLVLLYLLAVGLRFSTGFAMGELGRIGGLLLGFVGPQIFLLRVKKLPVRIENMLITLLILLLLASVRSGFLLMLGLGVVTFLAKTVLRWQARPLFNPAAVGLLVASLFGVLTTWWGVSFAPRLPILDVSVAILLTLPFGGYIAWKYQKFPTVVGVMATLGMGYFLVFGKLPFHLFFEGTAAFFLLIMATEPKTSPIIDREEFIWALVLGALLAVLMAVDAFEAYTMGLVAMNGAYAFYSFLKIRRQRRLATVPSPAIQTDTTVSQE